MSDDLEIIDPTELHQQGRNYYDELAYNMRQRIINFIRAAPEQPEELWKPLERFIELGVGFGGSDGLCPHDVRSRSRGDTHVEGET